MTERGGTGADAAAVSTDGDERAWAAAAAAALRKSGRLSADAPDAAAWDALARSTMEGLRIPPLGTAGRVRDLPTRAAEEVAPGEPPYLRGGRVADGTGWDVRAHLADPVATTANRSALADLEGGATSLWIRVGEGGTEPHDLAAVLHGVHLDMAPVVLGVAHPELQLTACSALADLVRGRSAVLHPDGNLGADPVGGVASAGLRGDGIGRAGGTPASHAATAFRPLPELLALATDFGVRAIAVDGTIAHDAGAGDAQEIGYTLAAGATYLRALRDAGLDVDTACGLMEFRYAATDETFVTIAKMRAARLAWHRVAELSGASPPMRAQRQHVVTSGAMLTRYDPWVNLLRTTIAAFAAGVGGAAAVTVLPFDSALGIPEEFGRRMARNISALLIGESHVAAVADPAGGAYAVQMLTADLAAAAWDEFCLIEAAGGIFAALADGSLAGRLSASRAERDRRIATRQQPITGVSQFPNVGEELPARRASAQVRPACRWAEPFEALRDDPATQPVLLLTIGPAAAASPRVLFIRNLLAAGGITVTEPNPARDTADAAETADIVAALARSGCRTVVLAGSDAAYADQATGAASSAAAARRGGADAIFLTGRPPDVLAALPVGLIDGSVAAGDDVLSFLASVRATLAGAR